MLLRKIITSVQPRIPNRIVPSKSSSSYQRNQKVSATITLDARWREKNRLARNTNSFGPLTNMADYSFKDGRPVAFGIKQMIRINRNREYLTKIRQLTGEIDYAVERHKKLEEDKAKEKQRIIDSKLKPKSYDL